MLEYFIFQYGNQILLVILCAIFGTIGYMAKNLAAKYINDSAKLSVARIAVKCVEQVWTAIHGPDKLKKALEIAETLLRKKGIPFDAEEMEVLIESAVSEFNKAFEKNPELPTVNNE